MIIYGGFTSITETDRILGRRYNPALDTWSPLSTNGAPSWRSGHTAVWTGTEMLIWGGQNLFNYSILNDGAAYAPASNSWRPIPTENGPDPRLFHTALWTGQEMIIWGGTDGARQLHSGARYRPLTRTWYPMSVDAPLNLKNYSATWIGSEMIVFGGQEGTKYVKSMHRYTPGRSLYLYLRQ